MTINSEVRAAGPFDGNGVTTSFPFEFKVFADSEVLVVREIEGVELVLALGADYTVDLNADQDSAPGGSVDLPAALPVGYTLSMTSALAPLQPVDLTNQGGFYPRVINASLDRLTILVQQLSERLNRALVSPISDGGSGFADLPGADARKGAVLAFDEVTGAPLVGPSIASVGTVGANVASINTVAAQIAAVLTAAANVTDITNFADVYYGPSAADPTTRRDGLPLQPGDLYFNTLTDDMRSFDGVGWAPFASGTISSYTFSGDGLQTAFVLPTNPITKNNTQVYIGGAYQPKGGYSVSGLTLTFAVAPALGVNNIEVVVLAPLPVSPLTAGDITDLIELRTTAVRKDSNATTGAAVLPSGNNAQRPGAPVAGMVRYNSEEELFEGYQDGEWKALGGDSSPLFSVMWWPQRSAVPAGYVAADGQTLSRATYPDAWSGISAGNVPTVADATWSSTPTERGKFTVGDGTSTFRLPDYNGKAVGSLGALFLRGDGALSAGVAGEIQQDALQAHVHGQNMDSAAADVLPQVATSGAGASVAGYYNQTGVGALTSKQVQTSTSSGARTASETRPLNVTGCWVIKLFGAVVNVGSADAAQLASDYANLASRVSVLEGTGRPLTKEYASSPATFTANGTLTFTHGLGVVPKIVEAELHCIAADQGYAIGDIANVGGADYGPTWNGGLTVCKTASQVVVRTALSGVSIVNNSTGAIGLASPAGWRLVVRALA